jgi:hypothetical protein
MVGKRELSTGRGSMNAAPGLGTGKTFQNLSVGKSRLPEFFRALTQSLIPNSQFLLQLLTRKTDEHNYLPWNS